MKNQFFSKVRNYGAIAALGLLQLFPASALQARPLPIQQTVKQIYATTPDGVKIAIQEYGNPRGPEIVLIHGLLGSHLNWIKQVNSPLLRKYRLITYDLRGHGFSGKPTAAGFYSDGKRWGDDLHTVIAAARLKRPTLVGWSLGGVVMTNYLQKYGDHGLAGLVFVDAVIELKPDLLVAHPETTKAMLSSDLATYLEGTRQFLRQCFFQQPNSSTFDFLYANAALAAPEMTRASLKGISVSARTTLPKVSVPVLLIQGDKDALVKPKMVEVARHLMPRAKVSRFRDAGHAPFFEQPARFNKELNLFVLAAVKKKAR